jgi:hypothetical protein
MDASAASTPLAAFVAGLVTSIHCAGMCGPLACATRARPLTYHGSRVVSYALAGALLGAAGQTVLPLLDSHPARFVPWLLAAILVLVAFGLDKRIPQPRFLSRLLLRVRLGSSLGWLTPLLPCGPLWLMFGVAILAASWWQGALLLASYSAGTVPLFWVVQAQFLRLQRGSSPLLLRTQQGLALLGAGLLVWRSLAPLHDCCH